MEYFRSEAVTIHHADCLDVLEEWRITGLGFDHAICDPPYSAHVHARHRTNAGTSGAEGGAAKDLGFEHLSPETMLGVAGLLSALVRRWVLVFSDLESAHLWRAALEFSGLEHVRTGAWLKRGAMPQITGDRPGSALEAITICHRPGRKRWNGGGKGNVWEAAVPRASKGRVHPTEKPLDLMRQLVLDFTDLDDVILDPFAGSGSTGRAAVSEGRIAVLIERDERWCAEAASRFGASVPQRGGQTGLAW